MTAHQTSEGGQKPLIPMQRGTVALDGFGEEEYATTTPWLVETAVPLTILNRYDFRGEGSSTPAFSPILLDFFCSIKY